MNINFFLSSRRKYEHIKSHLTDIINMYEELIKETTIELKYQLVETNEINILKELKNDYSYKRDCIEKCHYRINEHIRLNCEHNFVEDSIDIDCERSQNITYCTICEYTL